MIQRASCVHFHNPKTYVFISVLHLSVYFQVRMLNILNPRLTVWTPGHTVIVSSKVSLFIFKSCCIVLQSIWTQGVNS